MINSILSNSSEALTAGLIGGAGSRLLYGSNVINFQYPVLNYLNGWDSMFAYALIFGGATALEATTGDFVGNYLIPNNQAFEMLNKASRPMSIGVLSMAIIFLLNGFTITSTGALKAFALGAGANIAGQWVGQTLFPKYSPILANGGLAQPKVGQMNPIQQNPIVDYGFDPLNMNSLFGGFGF